MATAAMMIAFSGCVSHKKYNLLQADYNASQVALAESRTKVSSLETLLEIIMPHCSVPSTRVL